MQLVVPYITFLLPVVLVNGIFQAVGPRAPYEPQSDVSEVDMPTNDSQNVPKKVDTDKRHNDMASDESGTKENDSVPSGIDDGHVRVSQENCWHPDPNMETAHSTMVVSNSTSEIRGILSDDVVTDAGGDGGESDSGDEGASGKCSNFQPTQPFHSISK